jgi:glycosyltransferase involved in cell wall biosynthesis
MVFVHDTIYIREPQWFTVWEKAYLSLIRLSLHRGVKVLTSSRSEALHIERDLQLAHPVIPVGLGLNPELIYGESNRPELARGLDGFVLAVGRLNIRKNLERTIAGALETGLFSAEFPIIVVGSADGRLDENAEFVKKAISGGVVRFAGFLENSELRWLYQHCRLMTYLSLAEGFGLPPLEAISLGAEVLASDLPVFREVLGEGATYVDPLSENEIAKAITAILSKSSRSLPSAGGEFNVLDSGPNWEAVVRKVRAEVGCTARMGNAE